MKIIALQILALVQGLTEFLPVSSSGHLALLQRFFGIEESQFGPLLEVLLHAATLVSVCIFFRKRICTLLTGIIRREKNALRYAFGIIVSCIPAGILYAVARDAIEASFGSIKAIGAFLIITAIVLYSLKFLPKLPTTPSPTVPSWKRYLLIGIAQAIAILPGISRSGSTYTTGRWLKLTAQEAFDFSFLMSIPVIGGAILLKMRHFSELTTSLPWPALICAMVIAASVGYSSLVILSLIRVAGKMHIFAYWCLIVGIIALFI